MCRSGTVSGGSILSLELAGLLAGALFSGAQNSPPARSAGQARTEQTKASRPESNQEKAAAIAK